MGGRHNDTMYKQKVFKILYEHPKMKTGDIAERLGMNVKTVISDRMKWKRMNEEERIEAYREAVKMLKPPVQKIPEERKNDISSMDGFHTPYNFQKRPRSRIWVGRY